MHIALFKGEISVVLMAKKRPIRQENVQSNVLISVARNGIPRQSGNEKNLRQLNFRAKSSTFRYLL